MKKPLAPYALEGSEKYSLSEADRQKILASIPNYLPDPLSKNLSKQEAIEIQCSLIDVLPAEKLLRIRAGMSESEYLKILEEQISDFSADKSRGLHNQIANSIKQITELKIQIQKHEALILIARNKLKNIQKKAGANIKRGAPPRIVEITTLKKEILKNWIESLQETLEVKNFAELERLVDKSDQRNWAKWKNGEVVITSKNLMKLLGLTINDGKHKGKILFDIPTTPPALDIFNLICQNQYFPDGEIKFE